MPEEKIPSLLGPFPLLQTSLAAERRSEVTKLYYHSLENILQSEEKASGLPGAVALLSAGKFHRALVACCVEVVAACYRMVSCAFPKVSTTYQPWPDSHCCRLS
jgi:retinoblastoma-like protein 1